MESVYSGLYSQGLCPSGIFCEYVLVCTHRICALVVYSESELSASTHGAYVLIVYSESEHSASTHGACNLVVYSQSEHSAYTHGA
ncbi:hypothetical protein FKM82_029125 [Ascaphus truei]